MSQSVTADEANVLAVARMAAGLVSPSRLNNLLSSRQRVPETLSPAARRVLEDTLSRGLLLRLARRGAWQKRYGRRWWQGEPNEPLRFTVNSFRILQWVLDEPLRSTNVTPLKVEGPLETGDVLLVVLLIEQLGRVDFDRPLLKQPCIAALPLVALMNVRRLSTFPNWVAVNPVEREDFVLLSGFTQPLTTAWLNDLDRLFGTASPEEIKRLGNAQALVLKAFLEQVSTLGRRDLAGFLVDAAATFIHHAGTEESRPLALSKSSDVTLRERSEARAAAASFGHAIGILSAWDTEHRNTRFIDDGYDQAQLLVKEWQNLGPKGFEWFTRWTRSLESLS